MRRGWQGAVLKVMGAKDYRLTAGEREYVNDTYLRLRMRDGGLLTAEPYHPTMWVRLWFTNAGRPHQRGYTVVNPDPEAGEFDVEFALHEGPACEWARTVEPGETIDATVMGTGFTLPDPAPQRYLLVGDAASIPAVNSLLDTITDTPVRLWLEYARPEDREIPLRLHEGVELTWVPREDAGRRLVETVRAAATEIDHRGDDLFCWAACDTVSTRQLTQVFKADYAATKQNLKTLGYWVPERKK